MNQSKFALLCGMLVTCFQLQASLVTLQVDLSHQPAISPDSIHVVGAFNGYDPAATMLNHIGGGRFATTLNLASGTELAYKFVNGNAWGQEEGVFGECAFNTYRYFTVPVADTILPVVCFGYCDSACTAPVGMRLACIGNSITWGWDLPDKRRQSYPSVLQDSLGSGFLVENFGAPGAAVIRQAGNPYHLTEQFRALMHFAPAQAILLLGTNDSKSAIWGNYSAEFARDYDSLVMALDTMPSLHRIWLALPTKVFGGLFGVNDQVLGNEIAPRIKNYARQHMRDLIDLRGLTTNWSANFPDGLHPDSAATHAIALEIYRLMQLPRPQIVSTGNLPAVLDGFAWQWYLNGDTVPDAWGGKLQALSFAPSGIYQVGVKIDSLLEHILISDSVAHVAVQRPEQVISPLKLFPNPSGGLLKWHLEALEGQYGWASVYGLDGKLLLQKVVELGDGSLQVADLKTGTYLLELMGENRVWRGKFLRN